MPEVVVHDVECHECGRVLNAVCTVVFGECYSVGDYAPPGCVFEDPGEVEIVSCEATEEDGVSVAAPHGECPCGVSHAVEIAERALTVAEREVDL